MAIESIQWVGFDLDGTLAHYDHWRGPTHIGDPVGPMVLLLKAHLRRPDLPSGRIITARVGHLPREHYILFQVVLRWWAVAAGFKAHEADYLVNSVTSGKDFNMVCLYDDRCRQVITNTGEIVGRQPAPPHVQEEPSVLERFQTIVSQITLPADLVILLETSKQAEEQPTIFLRVSDPYGADNHTGEPYPWKGRKWPLSQHMTDGEVVQTAFKALMTAVEHEIRETFTYKGATVFNPHFDIEKLAEFASSNSTKERD